MKILARHITKSLLLPLFMSVAVFCSLALIWDLHDSLSDFTTGKISPLLLFQFYALLIPKEAFSTIPIALLFSILYSLSILSRNREIVAMQASGISLVKICLPFILVSAFLTATLLGLAVSWAPTAEVQRKMIKSQIKGEGSKPLSYKSVVFHSPINNSTWYLQEINANNGTFFHGEIIVVDTAGKERYKLFAAQGTFHDGFWDLVNVRKIDFDATGAAQRPIELQQMDARDLVDSPSSIIAALLPPEEMTWSDLVTFIKTYENSLSIRLAPYKTEHFSRMAYPFSCLVLCFFGIALGINLSRKDVTASVFNCIFILFAFIVWIKFSTALGAGSRLPPAVAAWSGITLFGIAGTVMFADRVGWLWEIHSFLTKKDSN